jgi:hypothetical protein
MKNIPLITTLLIINISCNGFNSKTHDLLTDSSKVIISKKYGGILDDYTITDNMFDKQTTTSNQIETNSNWFVNDTINQTLVFELYSDNHRMYTFHFMNDKIDNYLIESLPFSIDKELKNKNEKIAIAIPTFIKTAKRVNKTYFITKNGLFLGQQKSEVLTNRGTPNSIMTMGNIEKYSWGIPTNRIEMYFEKERLIAIFIYRDLI